MTAVAILVALSRNQNLVDSFGTLRAATPTTHRTTTQFNLRATIENDVVNDKTTTGSTSDIDDKTFFSTVMAANRAEIAVRIMRAATEMNAGTVGIYVHEDRYSQHRWGADRSFLLEKAEGATPISAYLDIPQIIKIAKDANVDAIHPGYGTGKLVYFCVSGFLLYDYAVLTLVPQVFSLNRPSLPRPVARQELCLLVRQLRIFCDSVTRPRRDKLPLTRVYP